MTQETKHFKGRVPLALREALADLSETIKGELENGLRGWYESLSVPQLDEISGRAFDGFIPFQDGGFEVNQLFRYDRDPTYHFTAAQGAFMDSLVGEMQANFCRENGLDSESFSYYALSEENKKEYEELELSYFNDCAALLRFDSWVTSPKEDIQEDRFGHCGLVDDPASVRVVLRFSVGYRDSPYFREKYDETIFRFELRPETILMAGTERLTRVIMSRFYNSVKK